MPEPDLDLSAANVRVAWGSLRLEGPGVLRLTSEALLIDLATGGSLRVRYDDLRGGGWRTGVLTVHGEAVQERRCPELAATSYCRIGSPPSLAGGDQLTRASPPATRSAVALTRCGASGAPRSVTRISPLAWRPGPSDAS